MLKKYRERQKEENKENTWKRKQSEKEIHMFHLAIYQKKRWTTEEKSYDRNQKGFIGGTNNRQSDDEAEEQSTSQLKVKPILKKDWFRKTFLVPKKSISEKQRIEREKRKAYRRCDDLRRKNKTLHKRIERINKMQEKKLMKSTDDDVDDRTWILTKVLFSWPLVLRPKSKFRNLVWIGKEQVQLEKHYFCLIQFYIAWNLK